MVIFEAGMGAWALKIYNDVRLGSTFGQLYHIIVVMINMVLMLNLVIAILSETYARLASQKLGLYYDGIIASIPAYKFDKRYGIFIMLPAPFSLILLPLMPVFACIKDKKKLVKLNKFLVQVCFVPYCLIFQAAYIVMNLLYIIPAYLFVVTHKVRLNCCGKKSDESGKKRNITGTIMFIILGIPMLLMSQFVDLYNFTKHIYSWEVRRIGVKRLQSITYKSFCNMERVVDQNLREMQLEQQISRAEKRFNEEKEKEDADPYEVAASARNVDHLKNIR